MENKGTFVNIQAYKYDGTIYKQWNGAKILFDNEEYTILLLIKTKVKELSKKHYVLSEPIVWFFSKKYFFNYMVTLKDEEYYYYANLSSPFIFEDQTIKYIDFDFDVKKYPNKPYALVDLKEFRDRENDYPKKLKKVIYDNISILTELVIKKEHFFDKDKMDFIIEHLKNEKYI